RRECGVPFGSAPGTPYVPTRDLAEPESEPCAEEPVARLFPEGLRVGEQPAALFGEVVEQEAEAAVEVGVVLGAEPPRLALADLRSLKLEDVQMILGELVPRRLDSGADVAVLLVHKSRLEHPIRDLLAVDCCGQRCLELGDPLRLLADEVAEA